MSYTYDITDATDRVYTVTAESKHPSLKARAGLLNCPKLASIHV